MTPPAPPSPIAPQLKLGDSWTPIRPVLSELSSVATFNSKDRIPSLATLIAMVLFGFILTVVGVTMASGGRTVRAMVAIMVWRGGWWWWRCRCPLGQVMVVAGRMMSVRRELIVVVGTMAEGGATMGGDHGWKGSGMMPRESRGRGGNNGGEGVVTSMEERDGGGGEDGVP